MRSLYLEAVVAMLGGEVQCRRFTQTHWQGIPNGRQPVDMIDDVTAFEITCKRHDEESYESHLQRFLTNTTLESILWVNIVSGCVMFKRIRGLVAALLSIGMVLVAGIAGTTYGLLRANQKANEADSQRTVAENKTEEAKQERANAVDAEGRATVDSQGARDAEGAAKFQLAVARYDANRAVEARTLLHQIPQEYRGNFEWHYCNRRFQGSDITCYGHTSDVYEVAFTPDGKQLASTSSRDKTVWGVAFSPDGTRLVSASAEQNRQDLEYARR